MCGIAGNSSSQTNRRRRWCCAGWRAIAHRGPDGEGLYLRRAGRPRPPPAGDHRPVARRPPADGDARTGATSLTYNGEVYNFRELRVELEALGHRFRSHPTPRSCSTRFAEWGAARSSASTACSRSRSGTASDAELLLARDRYGIKPLYWPRRRRRAAVRLRGQGAARAPGDFTAALDLEARCSSTSRSRTSSPTARCSRASGCCRPGCVCASPTTVVRGPLSRVLGLRLPEPDAALDRGRVPRGARPAVPPGGEPPAGRATCRSART